MALFQRYLILAASLLGAVVAQAQVSAPANGGEIPRVVSIVALVNPGADYSGLFLMGGGQPTPLDIRAGVRGKKTTLPKGTKDITLARQGTDPATGKQGYIPVAVAAWPEAKSGDAVLIIGADAGSKEIKALAFDDSLAAFPIETTRVVNLTGTTLVTKIDTFQGELRHASVSAPIRYPDLKKLPPNTLARYPFAFGVKAQGGELLKLGSGFWEAASGRRSLVVIQPPLEAGSTKIRIRTLIDYPSLPAPAAPSR